MRLEPSPRNGTVSNKAAKIGWQADPEGTPPAPPTWDRRFRLSTPKRVSHPSTRSTSRPYHHTETAHAATAGARNHALVKKMPEAVMARATNRMAPLASPPPGQKR